MQKLSFIILIFLISNKLYAQKIGLVLSGGGVTGLAHIGTLKAFEEHEIPIDYITGTSSGAVLGALYSSGYSIKQIEDFVLSEKFQIMVKGKIEKQFDDYLSHEETNSSMISLRFSKDSVKKRFLPTNLIKPSLIDYELMELFEPISNACNNNFDSLMIPFRCVASDIENKKSIIFKNGHLNIAVRSSMTFPFFIPPIKINNKLMFDGGLYNNFPVDVMKKDFNPDFIIGSNVSSNEEPPHQDDIISQLKNMLIHNTDYSIPKKSGILINHKLNISTFDFDKVKQAIDQGYENTIKIIDSIKSRISVRQTKEELEKKRIKIKTKIIPFKISKIEIIGLKKGSAYFVKKAFLNDHEIINLQQFKKRYFRLLTLEQIQYLFPYLEKNSDSTYKAIIKVRKQRDFKVSAGGLIATRNVITGFVGFHYNHLSKLPISFNTMGYFGRFYNNFHLDIGIRLPIRFPLKFTPYFDFHKVDYFRNFFSFFNEKQPSFVVQDEINYGLITGFTPYSNAKIEFDIQSARFSDKYHREQAFTNLDTTDKSIYNFYSATVRYEHNTLNKKQNANAGQYIGIQASYISGWERAISGNINSFENYSNFHKYFRVKATFQNHFINKGIYRLGMRIEGMFSNQGLMHNYTSSVIMNPGYAPTPDAISHFLSELRANQYLAFGLQNIFTFKEKIDLRIEAHYFQPIRILNRDDQGNTIFNKPFENRGIIGSISLIYHSPLGPLRFTAEYYTMKTNPVTLQLSFGYILFRRRGVK